MSKLQMGIKSVHGGRHCRIRDRKHQWEKCFINQIKLEVLVKGVKSGRVPGITVGDGRMLYKPDKTGGLVKGVKSGRVPEITVGDGRNAL